MVHPGRPLQPGCALPHPPGGGPAGALPGRPGDPDAAGRPAQLLCRGAQLRRPPGPLPQRPRGSERLERWPVSQPEAGHRRLAPQPSPVPRGDPQGGDQG